MTGNNAIGLFDAYSSYSTSGKYNGNSTILTSSIPNNSLRWKPQTSLISVWKWVFLHDRINVSADYFNKITNDLIFDQPLPNTSGYSSIMTNIGKVNFYGADFHLSTVNIKKGNFTWSTDLTYKLYHEQGVGITE